MLNGENCDFYFLFKRKFVQTDFMTTSAIREQLYDYIRVADEKKIKAIYMMLEDEIKSETEWYKDTAFVQELDAQYKSWKAGKAKGYSVSDVDDAINTLKNKRNKK